jgi:diguanylate cyclase (GGDEF)-like protein/PAS domain S-box-containing protein
MLGHFMLQRFAMRMAARLRQLLSRGHRQRLKDRELELDTAINSMHQGLVMFDSSNRAVVINQRYVEMYGLSPEKTKPGCTLRELLVARTTLGTFSENIDEYMAKQAARGHYGTRERELPDGRIISVTNRPLSNGGWVAVHEDITDRRNAERAARRLIETSIDLILVTDRHGVFVQVSPSAMAILGYQPEEMEGHSALEFIYPDDLDATRSEMRAARRGKRTRTFETRYFHKDKRVVTLACTGVWSESEQRHFFIGRDMTKRNRAEQKLLEQKLKLDAALNNMRHGLCMFDAEGRIVLFNQRYRQMMEEPEEYLMGRTLLSLWQHRKAIGKFQGDPEALFANVIQGVREGKTNTKIMERPNGQALRVIDQPMEHGGWVATFEDITEQRRIERELNRNREFLDLIVENVPSAIFVKSSADWRYVLINRAGEKFWGVSRQDMIGKTAAEIFPQEEASRIAARDEELVQTGKPQFDERDIRTPHGAVRSINSRRLTIRDDSSDFQYVLGVVDDVTERKTAEARIAHLAHYDALTGLPNRVLFREQLEKELAFVRRGGQLAVLYLDLDHFKTVNDTLGHSLGDALLKTVAERLRTCLRDCDLIARLGGDEFAVVQTGLQEPKHAETLAQRLRDAVLESPFDLNGHQAVVDLSIGIALSPGDGMEVDELLKHADLALYGAKSEGRGTCRYFEPEMNVRMKRRRSLEFDLRKALSAGELQLHYQPVVSLKSGAIVGCEALLRWQHPERGVITPGEFIPVAEETGLINAVGEWVLRRACAEAVTWPDHIRIAVNVSPLQFRNQNLVQVVVNCLAATRLAPERLELEVTESVLMQNNEATLAALHQIRALGVRISMDDFGTGYSSLSYLRSFPFNKIKIDRSFINDLTRGPDGVAIVHAILNLAGSLKMTTTAEGVESEEQQRILRDAGCEEMQGFLFSRPVSHSEIADLLLEEVKATHAA